MGLRPCVILCRSLISSILWFPVPPESQGSAAVMRWLVVTGPISQPDRLLLRSLFSGRRAGCIDSTVAPLDNAPSLVLSIHMVSHSPNSVCSFRLPMDPTPQRSSPVRPQPSTDSGQGLRAERTPNPRDMGKGSGWTLYIKFQRVQGHVTSDLLCTPRK